MMDKVKILATKPSGDALREHTFKPRAARGAVIEILEKLHGVGELIDSDGYTVSESELQAGNYKYNVFSGTDDDMPPQPGPIFRGGRPSGNGRSMSGSGHYGRSGADQHLHKLEKDAYAAVIRAFTAQSEVISSRKEQLLVTLRQELRIGEEQHLEILKGLESNGGPQQFRDRRLPEEDHGVSMYASNVDMAASARKKPKTSHALQPTLPPPPLKPSFPSPPPPVASHAKRAPPTGGSKSKKSKGGRQQASASTSKPLQFGNEGLVSGMNPWVGKRVKIRWPEDNAFYEAVISDWDPEKDLHALIYDMNTEKETWEWVDLKELSSNDLQTIDGPPVNVSGKNPPTSLAVGARGTSARGTKKGPSRNNLAPSYGWGRPSSKGPSSSIERSAPGISARSWKANVENGLEAKGFKQFQLPSLDALVKQVILLFMGFKL
ncbi:hypothetical protein KP509_21G075800 [Ceratopteris richardii]|uniref:ENT domain-containing protein n=2 Tax=Ceratopteris richardii TaxID=49495 RepID=A0A8T2SD08_CERRI|nr:hypothetical protein KP509_21G075800 [Ceratopteris richardii]KAH7316034.1 hypothetical protein KP509_21G075800 [Ceratopteris richardii]